MKLTTTLFLLSASITQSLAMAPAPKNTWQCVTTGSWEIPTSCPNPSPNPDPRPCPPTKRDYWSDNLKDKKAAADQAVQRCLDNDPEPSECSREPDCRYTK